MKSPTTTAITKVKRPGLPPTCEKNNDPTRNIFDRSRLNMKDIWSFKRIETCSCAWLVIEGTLWVVRDEIFPGALDSSTVIKWVQYNKMKNISNHDGGNSGFCKRNRSRARYITFHTPTTLTADTATTHSMLNKSGPSSLRSSKSVWSHHDENTIEICTGWGGFISKL